MAAIAEVTVTPWPEKQTSLDPGNAHPPADARVIRIEVRGGGVQDVSNVPPAWDYEIVDHDDLESEGH